MLLDTISLEMDHVFQSVETAILTMIQLEPVQAVTQLSFFRMVNAMSSSLLLLSQIQTVKYMLVMFVDNATKDILLLMESVLLEIRSVEHLIVMATV